MARRETKDVRDGEGALLATVRARADTPIPPPHATAQGGLHRTTRGVKIAREGVHVTVGTPHGDFELVCRSAATVRFFADAMVGVRVRGQIAETLAPHARACGLLTEAAGALATREADEEAPITGADAEITRMIAEGAGPRRMRGWKAVAAYQRAPATRDTIALEPRTQSPVHAPRALARGARAFRERGALARTRVGQWLSRFARYRQIERARHAQAIAFNVVEEGFPNPAPWGATDWTVYARAIAQIEEGAYRYDPIGHALERCPGAGEGLKVVCEAVRPSAGGTPTPGDGLLVASVQLAPLAAGFDEPVVTVAARSAGVALGAALASAAACGIATRIVEPVPARAWRDAHPGTRPEEEVPLAALVFGRAPEEDNQERTERNATTS